MYGDFWVVMLMVSELQVLKKLLKDEAISRARINSEVGYLKRLNL